ncbi:MULTISPECIES: pyridoxal-phosphate dependent enzyme [Methylobacteriaceae]|uniref:Diaminopropionate ammonia-lyase n=2 Tax=Methylobacterium TaxID=407 RepID=A0AAJ1X027_9HYPH|nr:MULTISPECIES: pyridoxal-phosphate dependent enzyme [Methylobacterium]MCB4806574.1 pyridoxal-phosphate dependent enzyme [Methylobacterium brachiatum]MDQ0444867.1 diaminopropionate ammonia-lyase [Methylobacterium persicinum]MDQ0547630.1 diaminopropionate ammonia-lyase [Methylobacterium brachiatum]SFV12366.1 diaminopropionate ammonia-lyase [Methylobacterium sp. UNCCL125]GJE36057.1 Diaminopropionate ammonia-lyase [Methylobacterium persicinum]
MILPEFDAIRHPSRCIIVDMTTTSSAEIAAVLRPLDPAYAPTPLLDLPKLAAHLGVAQVLAKDEGPRSLGSFKSLGGTYAGLRALARAAGIDLPDLLARQPAGQPTLVCASDGNHGLAVAAAARFAGATARVFLHEGVPQARARRIEAEGAEIVWVAGTYDDAVDAAAAKAHQGTGILVADTTDDPNDLVVHDVMAGYGVMATEIREQAEAAGHPRPTHVFVPAGVGGLAAAMAAGLAGWMAAPGCVVAVEPERAACLAAALAADRPVRVSGDLNTSAEMLSCGEASAPAITLLRRHNAQVMTVSERKLVTAPDILAAHGGPLTTPSGAASLAGALTARRDASEAQDLGLGADSRLLILITEGALAL